MPKYQHTDCKTCKFLGTYFDHDVYICIPKEKHGSSGILNGSVISRNGDDPADYASVPVTILLENCRKVERTIGGQGMETMPYQEYLFSAFGSPAERAMILALAIERLQALV